METTSGSDAGQEPPVAAQPPPSPLSGAYLLIVVGEPHTDDHKQDILRKIANGFLSWDVDSCHVALDKELLAIIAAAPEGEEARNGERLIQFASENLVTEVLIQPQLNTLIQCIRNLLSSFTKHRHIIHAGYTFAGNGSWIVQDGTFSLADLIDALQEPEVQRVLRAYEHSVTVDIHCAPEGDWSTARLRREACTRLCRVRVNPDDGASPAVNIQQFVDYLAPFVRPQSIDQLLHPSDVVGNIRFSHPTLYVFPGGQGDAALFGINGFNMLVDGGFGRKACFWDFVRHLDRLDAVLMTRINNSNCHGLASVLRRKRLSHVYPQIGHFFCNLQERKQPTTPDEEKVRDPLLVNLLDEGQEIVQNLKHLQMKPHICVRDSVLEPINLYHKVGHGKLDMYVISPSKDSKELKEFLSKWHSNDISLFNSVSRKPGDKDISFPFQNLVSICALLVWQPANPEDTITRILFPGSTPQHKIFEGLERLRSLDFMKQPVCTAKTLSPSSSTIGISTKVSKNKSTPAVIDKLLPGEGLSKPVPKGVSQTEPTSKQTAAKTATIPVSGTGETKAKTTQPPPPKPIKPKQKQEKDNKTEVDKNIEVENGENVKLDKPALITDQLKEKEPIKIKSEKPRADSKPKKIENKIASKTAEKKPPKAPSVEKKDSVKSSPTTPKKSVESKINGVASKTEIVKSTTKPKLKTSPSSTPAKSTKEENNRKVVESKAKAAIAAKASAPKHPKRDDSVSKQKPEKKPIKKASSSSPVKFPSKTFSPVKGVTKTMAKTKKDGKKVKGEIEKGIVTDSSTVSTPSTVDAETAITKEGKVEIKEKAEKALEKEIDSEKFEEKEKIEDDTSKDIDESAETKEKVEDASVSEDVISIDKPEDRQIDTSEKEYSEKEEEDEILIIEKVEIEQYGDDSVQDHESLESHVPDDGEDEIQKHLRDEAESEKKKDDQPKIAETQETGENKPSVHDDHIEKDILSEHESKVGTKPSDLTLSLGKDFPTEKVLTPENREQIEEEVQEIITSATDFVAKTKLEQSKESSELSAEGIGSDEQKTSGETKDLLSSPEKLQGLSDKNLTDDDNKQDDTKDRSKEIGDARYTAEESQPDEKMSTTVESGATTAPTLPEDERIPLDEIKEGVEEKYDKEDTKEKEPGVVQGRMEQPTTLPQVAVIPGGPYENQATQMLRDIVKTPDEVADLPVHEEVDGVYEDDDFSRDPSKSKDDIQIVSGKKEGDVKEDIKDSIAQKKEPVDKHEPIKSKEQDVGSDKNNALHEEIRIDEEELNELKTIRQKLEADDSMPEHAIVDTQPLSQGLEFDSKRDSKHEMVLETEPVHSMLKAPEVAELVMVTPDSAPDSPLHLLAEKKDKTDALPSLDNTQDKKNLHSVTSANKDEIPHSFKSEEIEESLDAVIGLKKPISTPKTPPASPILGDTAKEKDKIDISSEIVELEISKVVTDQIPIENIVDGANQSQEKASNVLEAIPEVIQSDKNDISLAETDIANLENKNGRETMEVTTDDTLKQSDVVVSDRESPLLLEKDKSPAEKNIQADDIRNELTPQGQTLSGKPDLSAENAVVPDIGKVSPPLEKEENIAEKTSENISPLPADVGESPKLEKEQIVKEKTEPSKSISPILGEKEDRKISEEETASEDQVEQPEIVSSIAGQETLVGIDISQPVKEDVTGKELLESINLKHTIQEQQMEKPVKLEFESTDTRQNKDVQIEPKSTSKEQIIDKEHELSTSISPVHFDTIESKSSEKESSITELVKESSESIVSSGQVETESKKPESPTTVKHETSPGTSPLHSDKAKTESTENDSKVIENIESSQRLSPEPSTKKDSKSSEKTTATIEKQDSPKSISPAPSDKDETNLKEVKLTAEDKDGTSENISLAADEKLDHLKISSTVPYDKEDTKSIEKEQIALEKQESPESICPVPSDMGVKGAEPKEIIEDKHEVQKSPVLLEHMATKDIEMDQTLLAKSETENTYAHMPTDKEETKPEEKTILEKQVYSKSISPELVDEPRDKEIGKEEITLVKQIPPKSHEPINDFEAQEIVIEQPITDHDTVKSISPTKFEEGKNQETETVKVPSGKRDSISIGVTDKGYEEEIESGKTVEENKISPKSQSPVLTEKEVGKETDKEPIVDKRDSPKSTSPLPSEMENNKALENEPIVSEKHVSPISISPIAGDKIDSTDTKIQQTVIDVHGSPKSVSPVPSLKEDTKAEDKKESILEKHDSSKPISPVPSINEDDQTKEKPSSLLEKHDSPKSISPVPSEKEDTKSEEKQTSVLEKHDSPKSISPALSTKEDAKSEMKEVSVLEKHESPKSISPALSVKDDAKSEEKESLEIEKHDSPKSSSPVLSVKEDAKTEVKDASILEKHDSPKSISPVLSVMEDAKSEMKEVSVLEKHESPKSISPALSVKDDAKSEEKEAIVLEKHDSPKSVSPVPSEKEEAKIEEKEASVLEKHDTSKSISPVPSEKEEAKSGGKQELVEKYDSPKSLMLSEKKEDGCVEIELGAIQKQDILISASPVPSDKGEGKPSEKEESVLSEANIISGIKDDKETQDVNQIPGETLRSINLTSDKKDNITIDAEGFESKGITTTKTPEKSVEGVVETDTKEEIALEKQDTPLSTSPVPHVKEDTQIVEKQQTALEKPESPKSISPVPSDKGEFTTGEKFLTNIDKHDTPKSISPVPSDKGEFTTGEKFLTNIEKHDTPKSISPVPSDKGDIESGDKEKVHLGKQGIMTSIEHITSEEVKEKYDEIEQTVECPEVVSTVPSDKEATKSEVKDKNIVEDQETPKSISPVPSDKGDTKKDEISAEKHDSPKLGSPDPAIKLSDKDIDKEQQTSEKENTTNNISPVSFDGDAKVEEGKQKRDSPKSVSPDPTIKVEKSEIVESITTVSTDKGEVKSIEKEQTTSEKQDSPKSISPGSSKKEESKTFENEFNVTEKHESPKSMSSLNDDRVDFKGMEKEQTVIDKQDPQKSISPVLPEKEDSKTEQQTLSEKQDTPKSISPVLGGKDDSKETEKEKYDSPKSISPIPSDKGDITASDKEPSGVEKHDISKSSSPLPSDKGNAESSEKEFSLGEKQDSPKSSSPLNGGLTDAKESEKVTYGTEMFDLSKDISSTYNDKINTKNGNETETEKADTELSEKDKNKGTSGIQLKDGLAKEKISQDVIFDQEKVCDVRELSDRNVSNESGSQSLITGKESTSDIEKNGKVHSCDLVSKGAENSEIEYHSSSSMSEESKQSTVITGNQLGSNDLSSTQLSILSDQPPSTLIGKHDTDQTTAIFSGTEDTVIEKSLGSKNVKTDQDNNADSESTVPSNLISSGLDSSLKESSADLQIKDSSVHSSVDNRSTEITEHSPETKSGLQSLDISSVSSSKDNEPQSTSSRKEEISSSVHRMLVTGSSEDGGTETELCLSSVSKLNGGSYDKNVGNVAHIIQEDSKTHVQDTMQEDIKETITSTVPTLPPEKTVITTTVYTTDGQKEAQISESTKPSDIVKTITTTITKTFGDHPTTDIKTTEEVLSSSGEKSCPADTEKSVKKSEPVSSGILSQSLKKEISDTGRSGTPASDLASERELETGGISTPHSDISSGQVSRAATHVWGESSEGRPDSRHCDSDDDIPCSPMSATSHVAQSPPQFDFDIHQHAKEGLFGEKSKESSLPSAMTSSFYGSLPVDPLEEYMKEKQLSGESQMFSSMYVSKYGDDDEDESKPMTTEIKNQSGVSLSKKEDIDFETAIKEHRSVRGDDLTVRYTNGKPETSINGKSTHSELSSNGCSQPESLEYQINQPSSAVSSNILPKSVSSQPPVSSSSSSAKPSGDEKKDPIEGWGKPLGLPPPPKNLIDSPLSQSTLTLVWNPADEWGLPLGLPSPAPPPVKKDSMNGDIDTEITPTSNKTTPKKVARRNAENNKSASNTLIGKEASNKSKHPESPIKRASNKDTKSKPISPVYMDLTYVPHHGNSNYTNVEFFKRIRARYYVFSGTEPSREVFNALLEAKQTWEDKDLEVTIIPTYDTDTLGYWVAENEDLLAKYKIDLSPSASRCTINLQDHETSCSAYRLEF